MSCVLAKHFRPKPDTDGPSWLTVIAQAKDSVWSVDLFRVESVVLRSHWVLLVMDIFPRRITGFGIGPTCIDGMSACRMFNAATTGQCQPNTSVPITIHFSAFTAGSPTCA